MSYGRNDEARDLLKQAIADLKQSLAKNPEDKEVRYHLGDALVLSGQLAEDAGQFEDALNCFEASSRHPEGFRAERFDLHGSYSSL